MKAKALLLLTLLALAAARARAQPALEGKIRAADIRTPAFTEAGPARAFLSEVQQPGARFLRLHFTEIADQSAADYSVTVNDGASREVLRYSKAEFGGRGDFWSGIVPGDRAQVAVIWPGRAPALGFRIDAIGHQAPAGQALSVSGNDDREEIVRYHGDPCIWAASRAVAKLSYVKPDGPYSCTGFLVSEDLLLTNDHCVNTAALCATTLAIFGNERSGDGALEPGEQFHCRDVVKQDQGLDFALLRIDGRPGRRWGYLRLANRDVGTEPLYVVGHPGGRPKQISKRECAVSTPVAPGMARTPVDFGHVCDTETGNSGSPVLDASHRVVGLHHLGFGEPPPFTQQNRAVLMKHILPALGELFPPAPIAFPPAHEEEAGR